jgi:DNA-binding transcriptional LysR family regulator
VCSSLFLIRTSIVPLDLYGKVIIFLIIIVKSDHRADIRRLTLHQLRVFLAVARRRSFTRAAEELLISQSAVSAQIRELTRLIGVPLFDQVGKKIFVTGAGRVLEEQAQRVEGVVAEIDREFLAWREGGAGVVRVGGSTSIGTYLLPSLIAGFSAIHPRVEVSLGIENTAHIEERLLMSDFDVGFVGGMPSSAELVTEPFVEDEIFFSCAPTHHLASSRPLSEKRLRGEKFFVREAGSATRRTMEDFLRERGTSVEKTTQLGSIEAIKQAVMAGLGISYFSSLTVRHEVETGRLVRLKVKGVGLRRTFFLVRVRHKKETPALRNFLEFARDWSIPD